MYGETVFVFKFVFVFEYSMDVGRWQSELLIGRRGTNVAANRAQLGRPIQTNSDQNQLKPKPIQTNWGRPEGKGGFSALTNCSEVRIVSCTAELEKDISLLFWHLGGEMRTLSWISTSTMKVTFYSPVLARQ